MTNDAQILYPLPISRALAAFEQACAGGDPSVCHAAAIRLADVIVYYLGAVAVAQYSQALYLGDIEADPTLNRSLRNLRRVLPGQWLGWTARGLAAAPTGPVEGLAGWYTREVEGEAVASYEVLRRVMTGTLDYTGEYGAREGAAPRHLLELIDQYRIRRGKSPAEKLRPDLDTEVSTALLSGLRALLKSAAFLTEYVLYAPNQRQLLMGDKATTPMPPMSAPADADATLLLYPPGELPDYTKRPNLQVEWLPLFPLDPLLIYARCSECGSYRVAALQEVVHGTPSYLGLDPDCGHLIS